MKVQTLCRGIAVFSTNVGALWRWVVSATLRPLDALGERQYPLSKKLGGPQDQSGWILVKRNSLAPSGNTAPDSPTRRQSLLGRRKPARPPPPPHVYGTEFSTRPCSGYSGLATRETIRGPRTCRSKRYFSLPELSNRFWCLSSHLPFAACRKLFSFR